MTQNKYLKKFLELHPDIDPNGVEIFYVLLDEVGKMQEVKGAKT